jgi:polyisoprenyl-teichoic acid--peptidoglycan teichoic acid transferase
MLPVNRCDRQVIHCPVAVGNERWRVAAERAGQHDPVESFGGDGSPGDATYRLREADTRELVAAHLAGSMPLGADGDALRVQVLNGVGVPGVGQQVDRRLDRGAFRIVLSDNASSFDFDTTQIIIYDESERALEAARRVQELLGVGTIQVSRQPQSVIDLTIVVGADFVQEG